MRLAGVEDIGGEAMLEIRSTESWMLPLVGISLFLGLVVLIIAALATRDWRLLIPAFGCYVLIAAK